MYIGGRYSNIICTTMATWLILLVVTTYDKLEGANGDDHWDQSQQIKVHNIVCFFSVWLLYHMKY